MAQIVSSGHEDSPFDFADLASLFGAMLDQNDNGITNRGESWVLKVVTHLQDSDEVSCLRDGGVAYDIKPVSNSEGTTIQRSIVFSFQSLLPDSGREIALNDELQGSLEDHWEMESGLDDNPAARVFFPSLVLAVACAVVEHLSTVGEVKIDIADCPPRYGSGREPLESDPDAYDEQAARHGLNGRCIEAVSKNTSVIARDALVRFISELEVADKTS